METIEEFISTGTGTPKTKEMLKQAYLKVKGSESGFDKYLADLESQAEKTLQ